MVTPGRGAHPTVPDVSYHTRYTAQFPDQVLAPGTSRGCTVSQAGSVHTRTRSCFLAAAPQSGQCEEVPRCR